VKLQERSAVINATTVKMKNKEYKNFLFIPYEGFSGVKEDCSDGYLTEGLDGNRRIKLPHNNYTLLGSVDECINSSYAEEFSKEIVEFYPYTQEGCGGYANYMPDGSWCNDFDTAVESMKTLIEKLDLKPTDYILRDDSNLPGINPQTYKIVLDEK
jgi:hypothetical protein